MCIVQFTWCSLFKYFQMQHSFGGGFETREPSKRGVVDVAREGWRGGNNAITFRDGVAKDIGELFLVARVRWCQFGDDLVQRAFVRRVVVELRLQGIEESHEEGGKFFLFAFLVDARIFHRRLLATSLPLHLFLHILYHNVRDNHCQLLPLL